METILWVYPMRARSLLSGREALVKGRAESGQVQVLAIFLFLLLIPTTVIIAQNSTINSTFTGDAITGMPAANGTQETAEDNQTQETPQENLTREKNQTQGSEPINVTEPQNETTGVPLNQTNETEPSNVTIPESNQTNENITNETVTNQTITNETGINETLEPEPTGPEINETVNTTLNETLNETALNETVNGTVEAEPALGVGIISPDNVTRGFPLELKAYARNTGSAPAFNLEIEWILPDGFLILSGSGSIVCEQLAPGTSCWNNITAAASLSSSLGLNDIMVRVSYAE
jgi:hypothetical protein